jgi:hypothetical protein
VRIVPLRRGASVQARAASGSDAPTATPTVAPVSDAAAAVRETLRFLAGDGAPTAWSAPAVLAGGK